MPVVDPFIKGKSMNKNMNRVSHIFCVCVHVGVNMHFYLIYLVCMHRRKKVYNLQIFKFTVKVCHSAQDVLPLSVS